MTRQMYGFQLSHQQARIWILQQSSQAFYVQCAILVEGSLAPESLRSALQEVVNSNEALRTTFYRRQGMTLPIQVVSESGDLSWRIVDLSHYEASEYEAGVDQWLEQERRLPIDFEKGPMLQASLLMFSNQRQALLLTLPALCADERSMKNILREILRRYDGNTGGGETSNELTQYVQYSEWQRELLIGEDGEAGRAYWANRELPDPSSISLLGQKEEAIGGTFNPAAYNQPIPSNALSNIKAVCDQYNISLPVFMQACWHVLLWRLTEQSEFVIGAEFGGREYEELEGAMGAFARWIPIHLRFDATSRFKHALTQMEKALLEAGEWQEYFSREHMLDANGESADFAVGFEYQETPSKLCAGNLSFSLLRLQSCIDRFKLKLRVLNQPDSLILQFHFDSSLFSSAEMRHLADRFISLLRSACADSDSLLSDLDILGSSERDALLSQFNATFKPIEGDGLLHQLIERQAVKTPDSVAVIYEDETISYRELNRRANQLAGYLRKKGVGPEEVVGICVERSVEMVIGLLGILKAGGAYLPLDLSYPAKRLAYMVEDSRVKVVLSSEQSGQERMGSAEEISVIAESEAIALEGEENPESGAEAANLAYVIYTSGSTGKPKGVMITHRGLFNYLNWCVDAYQVAGGRGSLVHTPIGFDLTVTSLFSPLVVGQRLALLAEDRGIEGLSQALLTGDDFSLVKITPAHLYILNELLPEGQFSGRVRALVIGGESLHSDGLTPWRAHSPDTRLINEYGPTETVVGCCIYEISGENPVKGVIPIGRPIANTQIYILNSRLHLIPIGTTGEIFIGGEGVARGYFNRPDLTAENFIPDPFGTASGARLYRTGDLGRHLPDGNLVFIGRLDNQVKIHGYRIELGEIEAVLAEHPTVREAVVIVQENSSGDKKLTAFIVVKQGHTLKADTLRSVLKEKLSDYMTPSGFVFLDHLPVTENGKVDRHALIAAHEFQTESTTTYVAPRTELEGSIADIWRDLLEVEKVGVNDNFFDTGGHSLLMVQAHSKLQTSLGRNISLIEMFSHPTIATLAEYLTEEDGELAPQVERFGRADYRRASIMRQRQLRENQRGQELWKETRQ